MCETIRSKETRYSATCRGSEPTHDVKLVDISGAETGNIKRTKLMGQRNGKNRYIRGLGGMSLAEDSKDEVLPGSHRFLSRWKNRFCQILKAEIHTADTLTAEFSPPEVDLHNHILLER